MPYRRGAINLVIPGATPADGPRLGGDYVTGTYRDPPPSQRYAIRVRGHLGETMRSAFPALQAHTRGRDTVLTGTLPDQAALHGVLAEIEAFRLELLEVRRLPPY